MALQASLATSKILLLLGASVAGSILVQNGSLSDFLGDTYKVFLKHLKQESHHSEHISADPSLLAQLNRLRQELSSLAAERSSSITIVSGSSKARGSLVSLAVPALLIGATGYGYMRWKGFSVSDFVYVTRRSMSNAVSSVSKQLDQVTSALSATKRHLTSKLDHLSGNLDRNMEVQAELKNEVSLVCKDVSKYGLEIETVQRLVQVLGSKIDTIENKQDLANMGVVYLCNFVEKMKIMQPPLDALQGPSRPRIERGGASLGSTGLKDLQSISYALESGADAQTEDPARATGKHAAPIMENSNNATTSGSSSTSLKVSNTRLQRHFTSLSPGFTRSLFSRS